jgi:hypothetical protein
VYERPQGTGRYRTHENPAEFLWVVSERLEGE